jgi:hypothetical protein
MRLSLACQGLNNTQAHLAPIIQVNNIQINQGERIISWKGSTPGIIKGVYYPLEYQFLLDRHQYSLLLSDGSFFQFFYQFDNNDDLVRAKLAFYPAPVPTRDSNDEISEAAEQALDRGEEALYEHLYNWTELMEIRGKLPSNTSHVRFDFDRDVTTHSKSHLQFGGVQEFRVAASFFPQSLAFVQLCESLLAGVGPLAAAQMGFERNHPLSLVRPSSLICLDCESSK